mmetsp:Transcript_25308/g.74446  ORF Transcript_25308/g.74446 Transcript_25308/m.74446 type:complete len:328 (-) Transcript_25308:455-1438(-)
MLTLDHVHGWAFVWSALRNHWSSIPGFGCCLSQRAKCIQHRRGQLRRHPERSHRIKSVKDRLESSGLPLLLGVDRLLELRHEPAGFGGAVLVDVLGTLPLSLDLKITRDAHTHGYFDQILVLRLVLHVDVLALGPHVSGQAQFVQQFLAVLLQFMLYPLNGVARLVVIVIHPPHGLKLSLLRLAQVDLLEEPIEPFPQIRGESSPLLVCAYDLAQESVSMNIDPPEKFWYARRGAQPLEESGEISYLPLGVLDGFIENGAVAGVLCRRLAVLARGGALPHAVHPSEQPFNVPALRQQHPCLAHGDRRTPSAQFLDGVGPTIDVGLSE